MLQDFGNVPIIFDHNFEAKAPQKNGHISAISIGNFGKEGISTIYVATSLATT